MSSTLDTIRTVRLIVEHWTKVCPYRPITNWQFDSVGELLPFECYIRRTLHTDTSDNWQAFPVIRSWSDRWCLALLEGLLWIHNSLTCRPMLIDHWAVRCWVTRSDPASNKIDKVSTRLLSGAGRFSKVCRSQLQMDDTPPDQNSDGKCADIRHFRLLPISFSHSTLFRSIIARTTVSSSSHVSHRLSCCWLDAHVQRHLSALESTTRILSIFSVVWSHFVRVTIHAAEKNAQKNNSLAGRPVCQQRRPWLWRQLRARIGREFEMYGG